MKTSANAEQTGVGFADFREGYPQRRIRVLVLRLYPNWNRCRSQARGKFFLPRDANQSAVYIAICKSSSTPSVTLRYCDDVLSISSPTISALCLE